MAAADQIVEIHQEWRGSNGTGLGKDGAKDKNWDVNNPLRRKLAYVKETQDHLKADRFISQFLFYLSRCLINPELKMDLPWCILHSNN